MTISISDLYGKLKEIEAAFQKAVQVAQGARDEQVRLKGEFDAISKLKAELEREDSKEV
jgi:hypothetical protein